MRYVITLLFCLGIFATTSSFAQEETKKVVVVKKVIDKDGKETTKREEATGKDAEALLKKMKEEGKLEGVDIEVEIAKAKKEGSSEKSISKDISVQKKIVNGKEVSTYTITTQEGGKRKVMVWEEGDGEMPEEMAKIMKDVEVKMEKYGEKQEMTITIDTDESSENEEMHETHVTEEIIIAKRAKTNKVSLGVMIADDSKGVVVEHVMDDSSAQIAGIQDGDTILKINQTYIFNTDMLLEALQEFDKGDDINITFLRGGEEKTTSAKF